MPQHCADFCIGIVGNWCGGGRKTIVELMADLKFDKMNFSLPVVALGPKIFLLKNFS